MTSTTTSRRTRVPAEVTALREALAPYVNVTQLRQLMTTGSDLHQALTDARPPEEVRALLQVLADVIGPRQGEQIRSPADAAAMLMVEMVQLDQEHLRVICLNTKNRVQKIHTVYVGSLNTAVVRVGELFKEALKINSAAIIVVHNHPSGDPTPSPEDVMITRQIVAAGQLMDVEVLDHLVIGRGRFVSMREKGLAFEPT